MSIFRLRYLSRLHKRKQTLTPTSDLEFISFLEQTLKTLNDINYEIHGGLFRSLKKLRGIDPDTHKGFIADTPS